jgi:hypothetical protein
MNNKNLNFFSLIMLFLTFTLNSCSEDSKLEQLESSDLKNKSYSANINPMEFVGVEHNKFMTEFTALVEEHKNNGGFKDIEYLSDDFRDEMSVLLHQANNSYYPENNTTVEFYQNAYDSINIKEIFTSRNNMLKSAQVVLSNQTTEKDKEFTMNLLNDILYYDNSNSKFKSLQDLIAYHESIILNESWKENETSALGAVAIAKHSNIFWTNSNFLNGDYEGKTTQSDPRSGIIVGADAAGYVIGGVVGGVAGTTVAGVTFGAGTVVGVIAGKFVGGFVGSGAAATGIAIYDAFTDFFD